MENTIARTCPFCGHHEVELQKIRGPKDMPQQYHAICVMCQATAPFSDSEEGAIEEWNERACDRQPATPETEGTKGVGISDLLACAEIGARWKKNSSLEEWFPFSAQKLKSLEAECGNAAAIIVKQNQELESLRGKQANNSRPARRIGLFQGNDPDAQKSTHHEPD